MALSLIIFAGRLTARSGPQLAMLLVDMVSDAQFSWTWCGHDVIERPGGFATSGYVLEPPLHNDLQLRQSVYPFLKKD